MARGRVNTLLRQAVSVAMLGGMLALVGGTPAQAVVTPDSPMPAEATETITTANATVVMGRTTSVTESGNNVGSQATIGEVVTYTVTTTLPGTTTVSDAVVTVPLGSRQTLVPGSLCVNGCTLDGVAFAGVSESPANTVRATLPTPYQATSANGALVTTFQATVLDVADNLRGSALPTTATLSYSDQDGQPLTRAGSVDTTIVEPRIAVAKAVAGSSTVTAEEEKRFTVTASVPAGSNVATAHAVTLVDTLPVGTEPVNINQSGEWDAAARTITWRVASIAPGESAPRTYSIQVESAAIAGTRYPNAVAVAAGSLSATPGARTSASTAPTAGDYAASATRALSVVLPTITTTVVPATATVGNSVTWTVQVEIPANVRHVDTTVVGTVPDGLAVDGYGAITCTAGCPGADPVVSTFALTTSGATQQAAWFLGDLAPASQRRTYELVLDGHVLATKRAGGAVTAASLVYNAHVRTNRTDTLSAAPTAVGASYSDGVGPVSAPTAVREPVLTLDTSADRGPRVEGGDVVTYTTKVTNTGGWPAYDVVVTDLPDSELLDVTLVEGASLSTDGWTAVDPDLRWVISGPLAAGASRNLTYTARLKPGAQLTAGDQVTNTAAIPSYHGATAAERADAADSPWREYVGPSDTIALTVVKPKLTLAKTPDNGVTAAGSDITFTITVRNTDAHATAHAVVVRDVLPAGLTFVSSSPSGTASGQTVDWTVGTLAPGATTTITLVARVGLGVATGTTLTNTASTHAEEVPTDTSDTGSLVVKSAPTITGVLAPSGAVDYPFSWTPTIAGDPTPALSVSGTLPPGTLFDSATGVVSGSPTTPGTYTFTVTATNTDGTASRTVTATIDDTFTGFAPTISGTADVGQTLTASPGVSFAPSGSPTQLARQWERESDATWAPIPDATSQTYEVTPADEGHRLRVQFRATRSSYMTTTQASGATAVVGAGTFTVDAPTLDGVPVVGRPVTCAAAQGTAGAVAITWSRSGVEVATGATYTPTPADLGVTLTCTVTASRAGFTDATADVTSQNVAPAAARSWQASVSGAAKVGRTLRAALSPPASGLTAHWQWAVDGRPVAAATGASFTVRPADFGKRVSVTVVVIEPGHVDARVVSAPTRPVKLRPLRFALSTSRFVRGRWVSFTASELAPRQSWVLRFAGGRRLARGKATTDGTVARTVRVPVHAGRGKRHAVLITWAPDRIRRVGVTVR